MGEGNIFNNQNGCFGGGGTVTYRAVAKDAKSMGQSQQLSHAGALLDR